MKSLNLDIYFNVFWVMKNFNVIFIA